MVLHVWIGGVEVICCFAGVWVETYKSAPFPYLTLRSSEGCVIVGMFCLFAVAVGAVFGTVFRFIWELDCDFSDGGP